MSLAGIGAVLGGLGSLFGGKQKTDYTGMKKGVQWRVADAKAAGIHPLAAMGLPLASPMVTSGSHIGEGLSQIGAGLETREAAKLGRERADLENELLRAQIAQTRAGTASELSTAQSRTILAGAAAAATGGASPTPSIPGIMPAQAVGPVGAMGVQRPDGTARLDVIPYESGY